MIDATDKQLTHLQMFAHAERLVDAHLGRRGIAHSAFRDAVIDHVARAIRMHGPAEGAKLVSTIAEEQAIHRANQVDVAVDAYHAAGGSRGLIEGRAAR